MMGFILIVFYLIPTRVLCPIYTSIEITSMTINKSIAIIYSPILIYDNIFTEVFYNPYLCNNNSIFSFLFWQRF